MNKYSGVSGTLYPTLAVAIGFIAVSLVLQSGSAVFAYLVAKPVHFDHPSPTTWTANLNELPRGQYYFSVGRPRGACEIWLSGKKLFSNLSSIPGLSDSLLVGTSFVLPQLDGDKKPLLLKCEHLSGFDIRLTHEPVISSHRIGKFLQLWRGFTELILGPLFSCILLITILLQLPGLSGTNEPASLSSRPPAWPFIFFALISVAYSFSLAYYSRLFLSGLDATAAHIVLRTLLSLGTVLLFGSYTKTRKSLAALHLIAIGVDLFARLIAPSELAPIYVWQDLLFPLSMCILTYDIFRTELKNESTIYMRGLAVAWTAVQLLDTLSLNLNFGAYNAPAVLAVSAGTLTWINYRENRRIARVQGAVGRILSALENRANVKEILVQIASIVFEQAHFTRVSAYVDGFCLGQIDQPHVSFVRVMESGYEDGAERSNEILFSEGQGVHMASALTRGALYLNKGKDLSWFINVPIGRHACLNLSDERPMPMRLALESLEILKLLTPALNSLNGRLIEFGTRQTFALERLRSTHGDGKWDTEIGSIFADINDYTSLSDRYGQSFSGFVGAIYFPALIKAVRDWAVAEFTRGDEIHLVIVKPLLQSGVDKCLSRHCVR